MIAPGFPGGCVASLAGRQSCRVTVVSFPVGVMFPFLPGLGTKNFHLKLSHQILRHMHGVLNIDEKKLITQFG